jgi:DNA (cytosine-5)-methyltransferase 1
MRLLSLFAGIGGFDLAFERAGCAVVAQVESDPQCRSVLAEHWPNVVQFDDVRNYHARLGEAEVIVGGFPCQDLSVAGKRAGFTGNRSSLFFEMVRVIDECKPAYVVWENVPGLLSSNNGKDFASVLMALDAIGYHGAWTMLDAQFFGLAQRRRRVFGVFACGGGAAGRAAEILSFRSRMSWNPKAGGEAGETVAYALAAGAGGSKFGSGRQGQDTLIANPLGSHHSRQDLDNDTWITFESRYARNGRGAPDSIVSPLKAQSGGTGKGDAAPLVAQSGVRRLTPTKCERLQGFPDDWTASQSDSARYRMLGNAVAVPVVEWIARRLMEVAA